MDWTIRSRVRAMWTVLLWLVVAPLLVLARGTEHWMGVVAIVGVAWLVGWFAIRTLVRVFYYALTPFMMRLMPALAGTLMIPAMYFLGRQVASKRVATLTAERLDNAFSDIRARMFSRNAPITGV